ncbi:hypothetical protein M5K25_017649 [Dendrobium thyrsiflorum]|uniref:Uncharacterized protein n=1 Tax=Dendrobium thyrsiflorum TaxID=117978 RepID=A0ABD0UN38_DENTH
MPAPVGCRGGILLCRRQWADEVGFCYLSVVMSVPMDYRCYDSLLSHASSFMFLLLFSGAGKGKERVEPTSDHLHQIWYQSQMAEGSKRIAPGGERSLKVLWAEHFSLVQHAEELAADFRRFYDEVRRDLRDLRAQLERNLEPRVGLPATIPVIHRRFGGRRNPWHTMPGTIASDSDEGVEQFGALDLSDSFEEEPTSELS